MSQSRVERTSKHRTGDLYLESTWSIESLINKGLDPDSVWNNVGIFVVEPGSESELDRTSVFMMDKGELTSLPLREVLSRPHVKQAAKRSLAQGTNKNIQINIEKYLSKLSSLAYKVQSTSSAIKLLVNDMDAKNGFVTSSGMKIDKYGKDLKAPKLEELVSNREVGNGMPNFTKTYRFTPSEFVNAALSQAGIVLKYDSGEFVSVFQNGGPFDKHYEPEEILFSPPFGSDDETFQDIEELVKAEAAIIIRHYMQIEKDEERRVLSSKKEEIYETPYVEHPSNHEIKTRQYETSKLAAIKEAESVDRKLKRAQEAKSQYDRPFPKYK